MSTNSTISFWAAIILANIHGYEGNTLWSIVFLVLSILIVINPVISLIGQALKSLRIIQKSNFNGHN